MAGVVLAVVQAMLAASVPGTVSTLAVVALLVVVVVCMPRRAAPAELVVRAASASFTAPVRVWPVYFALCMLGLAGDRVGTAVRSVRTGDVWPAHVSLAVLEVVLALILVAHAWRGYDISLRRDGLYDRRSLGTVFVPWEAVPAAQAVRRRRRPTTSVFPPGAFAAHHSDPADRPDEIRLGYVRPELVRRRGLVWDTKRIQTAHIDVRFLAAAIRYYATRPEQQAAIGTDEGYRRLRQAAI